MLFRNTNTEINWTWLNNCLLKSFPSRDEFIRLAKEKQRKDWAGWPAYAENSLASGESHRLSQYNERTSGTGGSRAVQCLPAQLSPGTKAAPPTFHWISKATSILFVFVCLFFSFAPLLWLSISFPRQILLIILYQRKERLFDRNTGETFISSLT